MAKIENLDDHRLGEKLVAHLAMAAADEPPPEMTADCLSDEQIADLATNFCSKEEREIGLAHLAGCPRCYDAWVAVSMSLMAIESGTTRPFKWQSSIKGLTYIGSALAVAASVVVFLNIREMPITDMPLETERTPPVERLRKSAPPASTVPKQEKTTSGQSRLSEPSSAPSQKKNTVELKGFATGAVAEKQADFVGDDTAPVVPEVTSVPTAIQESETGYNGLTNGSAADVWLRDIARICKDSAGITGWNNRITEGRTVLGQESNPERRRKMESVLAIMTDTDQQSVMAGQCTRILPLLAGEGD